MVTVSPPVSPSVVAAILMIQKTSVTSGTLLAAASAMRIVSIACRYIDPTAASEKTNFGQNFVELFLHFGGGRNQRGTMLVGLEHAKPLEHVFARDRACLQRDAAKQRIKFQIECDGAVDVTLGKS